MTNISRRLEQVVKKQLSKFIIPIKVENGILVGSILIRSEGHLKSLYRKDQLIYKDIHLNAVAIKLANLLAAGKYSIDCDQLYRADQEYSKWYTDTQILRTQYEKFKKNGDFERADVSWARYCESRDRTEYYKSAAEALAKL